MKKYCFDFIRESVLSWNMDILEKGVNEGMIEMSTPMGILIYCNPFLDQYGEEIENLEEYYRQRAEYVRNLAEEINLLLKKNGNSKLDSLRAWFKRQH